MSAENIFQIYLHKCLCIWKYILNLYILAYEGLKAKYFQFHKKIAVYFYFFLRNSTFKWLFFFENFVENIPVHQIEWKKKWFSGYSPHLPLVGQTASPAPKLRPLVEPVLACQAGDAHKQRKKMFW